ncbi:1-deoxy-D-xylulose-5-phosphate reductoisomerase [Mesorhizobium retamae]|uniref:1-deoxy-D-xylulose 5-phosphate reductoisomerase n=1 Tax=Mesorhizobium retamae TaxID=2912854 RepID=A0ABS9QLX3_9HYPH|nr:1-deoxy-D-xylulose-5-phosphate reductoisomerase [Mesorhizobium sp. IRAMC:0171]MCG7508444.1 1-deoxy-D-xylulose-5-phosphate reductoisomerase [Mesorhizobium sp. IRAMC:0171]
MQRLTVLGSTGSVGASTLDLVARHRDRFSVFALTAHGNLDRLFEQCVTFQPQVAVVADAERAAQIEVRLRGAGLRTEVAHGRQALCAAARASSCDTVVAAIVGAAGLPPILEAARSAKKILLANKEALVMSGALLMRTVASSGATLLPIDSEHNAIFQCYPVDPYLRRGISRLILTASGGPFLTRPLESFATITPAEACAHPRWTMGRKISVDSATMMNKGLEVIEARWLFDTPASRIDILIHPQSIVHSMVTYADRSVLAQLGPTDMRVPIAHALAYPERLDSGLAPLDLASIGSLTFAQPDLIRFPSLGLALAVANADQGAVTLNAANEVAVAAFLDGHLPFTAIAKVVEKTLELPEPDMQDLDSILEGDRLARDFAGKLVEMSTGASPATGYARKNGGS